MEVHVVQFGIPTKYMFSVLHVSSIHKSNVYVKSAMLTPSGLFNTVLMWQGPAVIMNKSKRPLVNVVS